ncbi:hypothetical protein QCA50_015235 [Cerrena zonata]|uniref:Uncharacterized protein n=1 Tax=Cerrena zonata TaxID=2478898 RepID=A0AAW0FIG1_9APHY
MSNQDPTGQSFFLEEIFTGPCTPKAAATTVFLHNRIISAVMKLINEDKVQDAVWRRRWEIGLYYEIRELKESIGQLMLSGCTGGRFFESGPILPFIVSAEPGEIVIDWDLLGKGSPTYLIHKWVWEALPPSMVSRNEWWEYSPGNSTKPVWWDANDTKDYIPEQWIAKRRLKQVKELFRNMRWLVNQGVGIITRTWGDISLTY